MCINYFLIVNNAVVFIILICLLARRAVQSYCMLWVSGVQLWILLYLKS